MGEKPPITLDLHPHRFYTLLLSQSTTWWKRLMRKTYNCIEVIQLFPCYYSQQHVVTARDIASVSLHTRDLSAHPWLGHLRSPGIHFPGVTTPCTWPCLCPSLFQQSYYTLLRCWLQSVRVAVSSSQCPASHTSRPEYLQPSNLLPSYFKILHAGLFAHPPNIMISQSSWRLGSFW